MSCSRPMICFYGKHGQRLRWSDISFPHIIKYTEINSMPKNELFRSVDDIETYFRKYNDKPIILPFDKISYCIDYFKNMVNTCIKTEYDKWVEAFNVGDLSMIYDIYSLYRYFRKMHGTITTVSCIDGCEYMYLNELYEDANVIIDNENFTHAVCNTLHLHDSIDSMFGYVDKKCVSPDITYVFNIFEGDNTGSIRYSPVFNKNMINVSVHEYANILKPLFERIDIIGNVLICNNRKEVKDGRIRG